MAIRQRGNRWQGDVIVKGKRHRKDFETIEEAEHWVRETRRTAGKSNAPRNLGDLLDHMWDTQYSLTANKATNACGIRELKRSFGVDTHPKDVDRFAIDQWVQQCLARGLAPGTINRRMSILSKALGYAEEARMIDRMPKINYVQVRQKRLLWVTKDEEQEVFKFLETEGEFEFLRFVTILLDTGMRPGELMALTTDDIDWEKNTILVYGSKTDKYRVIPMTGRVQQALKDQKGFYASIHTQRPIDPTGRPGALFNYKYYTVQRLWMRVQKHMKWETNDQHTLYVCRHTFASRLIQADVPLPVITQLMGHSSYQQTLHYAKLAGDQGQAAIATLEGLL